ncbi:hypothetical protein CHELA1G11_14769 [Hyphomicrobiales bacterium]|nr:hypothetical protein CHELA1G2_14338 [Hyphomicrobiales bacterium]CAH1680774.1 hypothetical protein CHELA1G11_14769 [Hyphomicrobiales bacterium]
MRGGVRGGVHREENKPSPKRWREPSTCFNPSLQKGILSYNEGIILAIHESRFDALA